MVTPNSNRVSAEVPQEVIDAQGIAAGAKPQAVSDKAIKKGEGLPQTPKEQVTAPKKSTLQTIKGLLSQIGRAAIGWTLGTIAIMPGFLVMCLAHQIGICFAPSDRLIGRSGGDKKLGVDDLPELYINMVSSFFKMYKNPTVKETKATITETNPSKQENPTVSIKPGEGLPRVSSLGASNIEADIRKSKLQEEEKKKLEEQAEAKRMAKPNTSQVNKS